MSLTVEGWSRAQPCRTLPWISKPNSPGTYLMPVLPEEAGDNTEGGRTQLRPRPAASEPPRTPPRSHTPVLGLGAEVGGQRSPHHFTGKVRVTVASQGTAAFPPGPGPL